MENTQKGYIVPLILIIILLGLAGYFLFAGQSAEAPIADETPIQPVVTTPVVPATGTADSGSTTDDEDSDEPTATSTASTTVDIEAGLE